MPSSLDPYPALAAFLTGSPLPWAALQIDERTLLTIADAEDLSALIVYRLSHGASEGWPARVRAELVAGARVRTGEELARAAETRAVLAALSDAGVRPLLVKGTALAYTVYDAPALRGRADTDLFIDDHDIDAARRVFADLGYRAPDYCADLFAQFEMERRDEAAVRHVFDIHWQISTQPVFRTLLSYHDAIGHAQGVPGLGPHAMTLHPVEALLLACVHPVMHHRRQEAVLWMYDIHLLAGTLSASQFEDFAELAVARHVAAICRHQLQRAETLFRTVVPASVFARLAAGAGREPSAAYLSSDRRWHHELALSVRGLPSAGARAHLLREVLLPSHDYMLGTYGLRGKRFAALLLPALYVHRNVRGIWKVLSGKK